LCYLQGRISTIWVTSLTNDASCEQIKSMIALANASFNKMMLFLERNGRNEKNATLGP